MKKPAKIVLGVLGVATVASLAVHIPMLFRAHGAGGGGGCPFGYDKVAAGPIKHDPKFRGATRAGERPALGFVLDVTTRPEVAVWATAHGGTCSDHHGELECDHVGAIETAWFRFGGKGTLDAVRTMRRAPTAAAIASTFTSIEADVTARAGAPAIREGEGTAVALGAGLMRQATLDYRFADYRALVRATNLGASYALTEEYATLVD